MNILLLGKNGQVGWELQRALAPLGQVTAFGSTELNLRDTAALRECIRKRAPDCIINAAAYTAVDQAETNREGAFAINAEAPAVLAEEAARLGAWLVHYSTDYVFDGSKASPYNEDDATAPTSVYGQSKAEGEARIRDTNCKHLILRTSWVFALRGGNFAKTMLRLAQERDALRVVADQTGAPTSAELIADVTAQMLRHIAHAPHAEALTGTYHLTAAGSTSWHGFASYLIDLARTKGAQLKVAPEAIEAIPTSAYPLPAQRPANSQLATDKLRNTFDLALPDWSVHASRFVEEFFIHRPVGEKQS